MRPPLPMRRRVTLLERLPGSGQRKYREHPTRCSIRYLAGGIRTTALGGVEASTAKVVFTVSRNLAVEPGWRIRDDRDRREYEVRFRQPLGGSESAVALHCQVLSGVTSRIAA